MLSKIVAGVVFFAATIFGQEFEVASIKPAVPFDVQGKAGKMHVGLTIDAARVDIGSLSLSELITIAYRVKRYQIVGPDWIKGPRFDVQAKIPEGVSKDKVPEMLQALLADRFKLTIHRDNKDQSVFALVVGKGGPKMTESDPDDTDPDAPVKVTNDGKGAVISSGKTGPMRMTMGANQTMHMEAAKMSMTMLAEMLTPFLDRPVVDMTELKGNFKVAIELSMDDMKKAARSAGMMMPGAAPEAPAEAASDPSGGSIFQTVQQLGLKLEPRKAPVETIVIDHVEKTPTEN